jgi:hypothetical protein
MALLLAAAGLLLVFFQQFPIEGTMLAIDWRGLWQGLRANPPLYGNATGLRIAPWDLPVVIPLSWLPFRASWGMLTLLTLAVLVASVPRAFGQKRLWLGCLLLVASFPALRNFADGNFEAMMIAGLLLTVYGYEIQNVWLLAAGLLLATAKGQETWLLCLVLGVYLWRSWPRRKLLGLAAILAPVVLVSMLWEGRNWVIGASSIEQRGSILDSSLWATLARLGWPGWAVTASGLALAGLAVFFAWRSGPSLSRPKAAALVAAGLLLAPYAAGNSFLTVLAVGMTPLVLAGNGWAVLLLVLADLPILASPALAYQLSATYWTAMLLATGGLLALQSWQAQRQPAPRLVAEPAKP